MRADHSRRSQSHGRRPCCDFEAASAVVPRIVGVAGIGGLGGGEGGGMSLAGASTVRGEGLTAFLRTTKARLPFRVPRLLIDRAGVLREGLGRSFMKGEMNEPTNQRDLDDVWRRLAAVRGKLARRGFAALSFCPSVCGLVPLARALSAVCSRVLSRASVHVPPGGPGAVLLFVCLFDEARKDSSLKRRPCGCQQLLEWSHVPSTAVLEVDAGGTP